MIDDEGDFELGFFGVSEDNFVREGGIVELFLLNLLHRVPVGLANGGCVGLIETFGLTAGLHLRLVAHLLALDGAFDHGRVPVVINADERGGLNLLLGSLLNDFSNSVLLLGYLSFGLDGFDLFGLGPGESNSRLPAGQLLVFTLDGSILIVGTFTLLHHRLVLALLRGRNFDHWAGLTERDAGNRPEERLHHLGHDLERVARVLDEEAQAV